jgi:hypothetical protein
LAVPAGVPSSSASAAKRLLCTKQIDFITVMAMGCQAASTPSHNVLDMLGRHARVTNVYQYIVDQNELYTKWDESASFGDAGKPSSHESKGRINGSIFPSLEPRIKRNAKKRQNRAKKIPVHSLSTVTAMTTSELIRDKPPVPKEKRPVGRPRKPVLEPPSQ